MRIHERFLFVSGESDRNGFNKNSRADEALPGPDDTPATASVDEFALLTGEFCPVELIHPKIGVFLITADAADSDWQNFGTTRTLTNGSATGGNVHAASDPAASTPRPAPISA